MDSCLRPIDDFAETRAHGTPKDRLRAIRKAAAGFRERMLSAAPVRYYRSFDLIRVPYPLKYALRDACTARTPYIHIMNRLFVVKVDTAQGLKTILLSPSDALANRETPYFKRLVARHGALGRKASGVFAPQTRTVEQCLEEIGLTPDTIDYISYDHLHTQDLRRWLGTNGEPGYFPNAKLLVMKEEWESARGLVPPQADWYCPGGIDGVSPEKIQLLSSDTALGESVAFVRTPGHTMGNHSFVVRTQEGLFVTSENGVGPDSYAPLASNIPGVRRYARDTGMEVVLNGNTLEGALEQYLSMVQEKEIAGPSQRNSEFPNIMSSSELTSYWLFPGVKPTFSFGEVEFGTS